MNKKQEQCGHKWYKTKTTLKTVSGFPKRTARFEIYGAPAERCKKCGLTVLDLGEIIKFERKWHKECIKSIDMAMRDCEKAIKELEGVELESDSRRRS